MPTTSWPCSARNCSSRPRATHGYDDAYRHARETSLRLAGRDGIDKLLHDNNVVALVGPTMPPAWPIDAVNGDQISGGGAGNLAAIAGYPHLTVPMGTVRGLPVGLSFIGARWDDARILALGYAYEQASHRRWSPRFLSSIEESPEIAPHLRPHRASAASSPRARRPASTETLTQRCIASASS